MCETLPDNAILFMVNMFIFSFETGWMDGYRPTLIKILKNGTTHTISRNIFGLKRDKFLIFL